MENMENKIFRIFEYFVMGVRTFTKGRSYGVYASCHIERWRGQNAENQRIH